VPWNEMHDRIIDIDDSNERGIRSEREPPKEERSNAAISLLLMRTASPSHSVTSRPRADAAKAPARLMTMTKSSLPSATRSQVRATRAGDMASDTTCNPGSARDLRNEWILRIRWPPARTSPDSDGPRSLRS
jgi:hypothetical protein